MKKIVLEKIKSFSLFILTLFSISIITFSLIKFSPGDPAEHYLRASHIVVTKETVERAREELGLNKPIVIQYRDWLINAVKGDLGKSYLKKMPVTDMILRSTISTLNLGLLSFFLLILISLLLGLLSAVFENKFLDYIVQLFSFISASIPSFWLGYILIIIFAVNLKWLPVSGKSGFLSMILPSITLVVPIIGQTTLIIRKTIISQKNKLHYENAIICGVKSRYLIKNHLLLNSLIPIITIFSSNMLYLITGSVLIEEVFAYPGLGKMFVSAVKGGDMPVIQGSLLLFGIFAIIVNNFTEILVMLFNPRIRRRKKDKNEKLAF